MPVLAFSWLDDGALPTGLQLSRPSRTGGESALQIHGEMKCNAITKKQQIQFGVARGESSAALGAGLTSPGG